MCLFVYMSSVTPLHPAKAIGWNEMPLGRDTRVVSSNSILDRGSGPSTGRGDFGCQNPQFAVMLPIYYRSTLATVMYVVTVTIMLL